MGSSFLSQRNRRRGFLCDLFCAFCFFGQYLFSVDQKLHGDHRFPDRVYEYIGAGSAGTSSTTGGVLMQVYMSPALLFFTNLVTYMINSFIFPSRALGLF